MTAQGQQQVKLTRGRDASWAPDGKRLALIRDTNNGNTQTLVVVRLSDPNASGIRLARTNEWDEGLNGTDWSADGKSVLFQSSYGGASSSWVSLDEANVTTKRQRSWASGGCDPAGCDGNAILSEAPGRYLSVGQGVVFGEDTYGDYISSQAAILRTPGGTPTEISPASDIADLVLVSPDGKTLLYAARATNGSSVIKRITLQRPKVVTTILSDARDPDWQPVH
jgi:Tol biopolymer transport system component